MDAKADSPTPTDLLLQKLAATPEVRPFEGTHRYRVHRALGEGGFGVVYEVEDRQLGRRLALKTLRPDHHDVSRSIRDLKREFRSAADIVHPNLVGLHELSTDGERWFFTMDLVEGVDFIEHVAGETGLAYDATDDYARDRIRRPRLDTSGILSETRLREALRQLVEGVAALHAASLIHRDLKPSNVLVERGGRVVVLDFGLARLSSDHDASSFGAGTPVYMAPEQALSDPLTPACDWYAVGVMLYEALTGTVPFDGDDITGLMRAKWSAEVVPPSDYLRVPADLEALCLALLARIPEDRPDAAAILDRLGERGRTTASATSRPRPLLGRNRELERLQAAHAAACAGALRVSGVVGPPGMGKSALLDRFTHDLARDGAPAVLRGRCHEREAVPFKALDGVVDALQRYLGDLPRHEAAALMPRDAHLLARLFPVLEGVVALRDVPERRDLPLEPTELRRLAFAALRELLARIGDKQPLVVIIDDLQWSDADSSRLLASLIAPPEAPRMLLVLAHRPDVGEGPLTELRAQLGVAAVEEIALEPLTPIAAEELARQLLSDADPLSPVLDDDLVKTVAARGEGHPLFIEELARELQRADGAPAPSLLEVLWRRVERLPDTARALLETVAIAGQPRERGLCLAAAGLDDGWTALRTLQAGQLLRADDRGQLEVFHDRIREAVVTHLDPATERRRHLSLAQSLERAPKLDLTAVALHFDAAREPERAASYATRAGRAAMDAMAFDRAASMFALAIGHGHDALHDELATAHLHAGNNVAAGEAYLAAAAREGGDRAIDLTRRGAEQLLMVGDHDQGTAALDRALAGVGQALPASPRRARLELLYRMLRVRFGGFTSRTPMRVAAEESLRLDVLDTAALALEVNDLLQSTAVTARFIQRALREGGPRHRALALSQAVMACVPGARRRPPIIDELLERATAIGREIDDPEVLARAEIMRGKSQFVFGDWVAATGSFDRGAALMAERCRHLAHHRRISQGLAAICRLQRGQLAEVRAIAETTLRDARQRGDRVIERTVSAAVAVPLALAADDVEEARRALAAAGGESRCTAVLFRPLASAAIALYTGDVERAALDWHASWPSLEAHGLLTLPAFRVLAVRSMACSTLAAGLQGKPRRLALRALRSIGRLHFAHARAVAATGRAYLALEVGRRDRARQALQRAADAYDAADAPLDADGCRLRIAELGGGDPAAIERLHLAGIAAPSRWARLGVPLSGREDLRLSPSPPAAS